MYVFRLLGKIVDDARHGMSHFECWQMDGAVVYDCYGDFINEEIANFVDVEVGVDYSVTFRADENCRFEIAQVSFMDEDGVERFFDVREQVKKDSERMEYEAKNNAEYVAKIDKSFEQIEKTVEKPDVSGLLEALKYVDVAISEVDKIKVNLLGIKAQITKFVK